MVFPFNNTVDMGNTIRHLTANIDFMLSYSDRELANIYPNYHPKSIREELESRKANGELLIGSEGCEGFDPIKGCPGHPTT
jgi:hypothetical protein